MGKNVSTDQLKARWAEVNKSLLDLMRLPGLRTDKDLIQLQQELLRELEGIEYELHKDQREGD